MHAVPYLAFGGWLRRRHGGPVRKIPLDIGGSCPNRNRETNAGGCLYCNTRGSGTGLHAQGLSLAAQWEHWTTTSARRSAHLLYLAYLQSFSNTFRPAGEMRKILEELAQFRNVVAMAIGTRPDCLSDEMLDTLSAARHPPSEQAAQAPQAPLDLWLELGLQSASDATLRRIHRGHDLATLQRAVHAAAQRGLLVCLHVMQGLPGEEAADFFHTIDCVNALPVQAVKFHNTLVLEGSGLAEAWQRGEYAPPERLHVVATLAEGLARLRPDIVIQRLTADAWPGELLAPDWAGAKTALRQDIIAHMVEHAWQQGSLYRAAGSPAD